MYVCILTIGNALPTTPQKIMGYNVTYKCTNAEFNMLNYLVIFVLAF